MLLVRWITAYLVLFCLELLSSVESLPLTKQEFSNLVWISALDVGLISVQFTGTFGCFFRIG